MDKRKNRYDKMITLYCNVHVLHESFAKVHGLNFSRKGRQSGTDKLTTGIERL